MAKVKVSLPAPDSSADYEIREDMRTLQRAQDIMNDPKRMARVKVMAKKESQKLDNIGKGLRQMRG